LTRSSPASPIDMKKRIQSFDWSATPLGPIEAWPQSLKSAIDIVTSSPVPMVLLWGANGILIYNDGYAAFAGSRHPKLLGLPVLEAWPEAADLNRRVMECGLAGEPLSFRDKHLSLNRHGTPKDVWLNLDYSPVRDETGNVAGVLAIVVETTQWVLAERAQRESESRFRTLADNIAAFAWMADATGAIFWYNKRWYDYTGAAVDEARRWCWRKLQHPDHADRVTDKIERCLDTGEVWEDTFPLKGRDGLYRWFLSRAMPIRDEDGNVVRWFGTNTDITEHLEEAERNAQLATIVATSADAIISMSNEGIILSWNPGAERMFGYTADEAIGQSERLLFAEDADAEFEDKYRHLRHGDQVLRDTLRRRKDGTLIDVAINAAPMRRPDGRILGFSAVFRDVTERKRVETHLRMVMRELSHRTKNLLAVIIAMVRQTARASNDVAVLQSELIKRLQSLSASHDLLVAEDWAGASLEELIRAVLQPFIGTSAGALLCEGPKVVVNATAAQNLGLALHELATNAAKYGALSTPAGQVRITWAIETDGSESGTEAAGGEAVRLRLTWAERGGPSVTPPKIKGFGRVVIERVAAQALSASVAYDFPPEGVRWSIAIPVAYLVRWRSVEPAAASRAAR
jgi:PAS domain S-box-containing protein